MPALLVVRKRVLPFVAPAACYLQFHRFNCRFVVRRLSSRRHVCFPLPLKACLRVFQSLLGGASGISVDSRLTAFLLLVSGKLIRLEAIN
jgi:hypothetical protein